METWCLISIYRLGIKLCLYCLCIDDFNCQFKIQFQENRSVFISLSYFAKSVSIKYSENKCIYSWTHKHIHMLPRNVSKVKGNMNPKYSLMDLFDSLILLTIFSLLNLQPERSGYTAKVAIMAMYEQQSVIIADITRIYN